MTAVRRWCRFRAEPTVPATRAVRISACTLAFKPCTRSWHTPEAQALHRFCAQLPSKPQSSIGSWSSLQTTSAGAGLASTPITSEAVAEAVRTAKSITDTITILDEYLTRHYHDDQRQHQHPAVQEPSNPLPANQLSSATPPAAAQVSSSSSSSSSDDDPGQRVEAAKEPRSAGTPGTDTSETSSSQQQESSAPAALLTPKLCIVSSVAMAKLLQKQQLLPERHAATFYRVTAITAASAAAESSTLSTQEITWVLYMLACIKQQQHTLPAAPGSAEPSLKVQQQAAQQLAAAALPQLQYLTPSSIARLLWSLGKLQLQPPEQWVASAMDMVHLHMARYGPEHMLQVLAGLADLQYCPSLPLLQDLVGRMQNSIAGLRPGDVAMLVAAVSRLGYSPKRTWLRELLTKSRSKLSGCTAAQFADLAAGLRRMGCVPDPYWADAFLRATGSKLGTCTAGQLAQLLYSASTLKMDPAEAWVDRCLREARRQGAALQAVQVAQLMYSCMTLRNHKAIRCHVPWLAQTTQLMLPSHLQQLPPRHLAELLIAMAHFRAVPTPDWLQWYQQAAEQQLAAYTANDLAVTLAAVSQLKLRAMHLVLTTQWLVALIHAVAARAQVVTQDELAMAVAGLATIQVCQKAAGQELSAELDLLLEGVREAMMHWSLSQLARFNRELQQYSKSAFPTWYQQLAQHSRRLMVSKAG